MKDYYATLRIQQGRLKAAMQELGIETAADLSRRSGVTQGDIGPREECQQAEMEQTLDEVLGTLTNRERSVLKARFWEGKTLEETGRDHNIGGKKAWQIEAKALRKLRHPTHLEKLEGVHVCA